MARDATGKKVVERTDTIRTNFYSQSASSTGTLAHPIAQKIRTPIIAAAAFGGLYAGAHIGARLEPPCRCDDPGLKGAFIGMPIGAVAAGIAATMLTR